MSAPLCLALALLLQADVKPGGYARPNLLIEPAELARPDARKLAILDTRSPALYRAGHVPGAVRVDAEAWARAFAAGRDRDAWARRIGGLGIDAATPVVVYGPARKPEAARVWWILRYWGVRDVRLLDGGWPAYAAAGGKVEKGEVAPKTVTARLKAQPERLATKEQLLGWLKGRSGPQVLDARSTGEYCGTTAKAKRGGAIPGAKHLEWSDTLDPKTGKFKSAGELRKLFKEAGIDPSRPAVTYCQSGGRAALLAFVVELMGGTQVRNYYRSWSEWGNDPETPITRPKPKE
jgi:thiosulfate/3-mercaptopyruvate sulfurtransferase